MKKKRRRFPVITFATKEDLHLYAELEEAGVLVPLERRRLTCQQLFICCADGHRPHLWMEDFHVCQRLAHKKQNACFHKLSGNGKTLTIAYNSPLSVNDEEGRVTVREMRTTLTDVKPCLEKTLITNHWPCRAAALARLDLAGSIDLQLRGKVRVRTQIPDFITMVTLIKIDVAPGVTRTSVVHKAAYLWWLGQPANALRLEGWLSYEHSLDLLPKTPLRSA